MLTAFLGCPLKIRNPLKVELTTRIFFYVNQMEAIPVDATKIAKATLKDNLLSRVLACVKTGQWSKSPDLLPFIKKRGELSVYQGCIDSIGPKSSYSGKISKQYYGITP